MMKYHEGNLKYVLSRLYVAVSVFLLLSVGASSALKTPSTLSTRHRPPTPSLSLHVQQLYRHAEPKSQSPSSASALHALQGGSTDIDATNQPQTPTTSTRKQQLITICSATAVGLLLSFFVFANRDLLLNKERIQEETLLLLNRLNDGDNALRSLAMYSLGIAAWELCSLSTIPVETAAGMVFGWKAAPASIAGKMLGAMTAFGLGRGWLKKWATTRLESNSVWQLVTTSRRHSAWATAFLMKYSCFPEFIKNFGSSLLNITPLMFVIATLIHGGGFSLLWTWCGVNASLQLQVPGHVMSMALKCTLVVAGIVGVVVCPLLMAWWINSLRQEVRTKTSMNG